MAELTCSLEGLPLVHKSTLEASSQLLTVKRFTQGFCNCAPAAGMINRYNNVCKVFEAM